MKQRGFVELVLLVIGFLAVAGVAGFVAVQQRTEVAITPVIESISPAEAAVGATISIVGSGFMPIGNTLQFGAGIAYVNDLPSSDGKTITFTLPESFDTCNVDGSICAELLSRPVPGQRYEVAVINANGESNRVSFTVLSSGEEPTQPPPSTSTRPAGSMTITGTITCLPKEGIVGTMECAIGLQGDDGQYYGLGNLFEHDPEYKFSTVGLHVMVVGIFSPKSATGPGGSQYKVLGTIEVISIQEENTGAAGGTVTTVSLREGQRENSFLLQEIHEDSVTGLNFWEYPIATGKGYPITLRVGEVVGNGCTVRLTLERIAGDIAIFSKSVTPDAPCPICLAEHTLINTPVGAVPVEDLEKGMPVWTVNSRGERVSAVVASAGRTSVPPTHRVTHLVLDDGRELFVSPGHPTGDGRTIGDLSAGDALDGGIVVTAELAPYQNDHTYDILPSGETGRYWADGILIDSTLH